MDKTYVYPYSADEAKCCNQLDLWRESHRQNISCKKAIEKAIADNFDGNHLNPDSAKFIIDEYGYDRTIWVLANTVQQKDYDGRFSNYNKKWAKGFYIPKSPSRTNEPNIDFVVDSHPAVLDGFILRIRSNYDALNLFEIKHCRENSRDIDYTNKILVLKPTLLKDQFKTPMHQLLLAQHGFGCSPTSSGRKVYGVSLSDSEKYQYYRIDFVGVLKPEFITDEMQIQLAKIAPTHFDHLTENAERFDGYCYLGNEKYTSRVPLYGMDEVKGYIKYQKDYQHRLVICDVDDRCVFESVDGEMIFPTQEDIENHKGMEMEL